MPLLKSASNQARSENIRREIDAGKARDQAAAIAYSVQRDARKRLAVGGMADGNVGGWWERNKTDPLLQNGLVPGPTMGRADSLNFTVPTGAYVIPADVVAEIGEGNSASGGAILDNWLGSMGSPNQGLATGGVPNVPVPVKLSGGEYLVSPDHVAQIGGGDMRHGHDILDNLVLSRRAKHIKTLKKLPGPVK